MNEIEPMEQDHMEKLYTSTNPFVRHVHVDRLKKIANLIPKGKCMRILDAGCGEGQLLLMVSKLIDSSNEFYGTDILDVALARAKDRMKDAHFSLQSLEDLNFADNSFDIIMCTEVIEHIPNYKQVLEELKRILKSEGLLIISFPNEPLWTVSRFFLGRRPIKVPEHCNSFSPRRIIKETNLKVKRRVNVPFGFPSFLALTRILVLQNK